MLKPLHLRDLRVDPDKHPRAQPHLSAASGLVRVDNRLYIVADDEHHIGIVDADPQLPVGLYRIQPGDLPRDKRERKRLKPDLEALAYWPADAHYPTGALLALGSGSRPNRQIAFVLALGADGLPWREARVIDITALYQPLRAEFADLNIEGAFCIDGNLRLLQRANKGDARNASIDFPQAQALAWIAGQRDEPPVATRISWHSLGQVDGVPLGLTDGTSLPGGGWLFSAVAEDTGDSYIDGACAGSAIGWVGQDGKLQRLEAIAGAPKVEGIALSGDGRLLMVTDSDNADIASALLSIELEPPNG